MCIKYDGSKKDFCNAFIDISSYEDIKRLLLCLGYYSYVSFDKTVRKYVYEKEDFSYTILINEIKDIGSFVEFSVSKESFNKIEDSILKEKILEFKKIFDNLKLKDIVLSYRDFIAREVYNKNAKRNFKRILVNINDVIPKIKENEIFEAICQKEVELNFKLIDKLVKKGIEVIIIYSDLSNDVLNVIKESINKEEKYNFIEKENVDVSLNDTIIINTNEDYNFMSLANIILNCYK